MLTTSSMSVDKREYCHHFSASEFLTRNIGNCECEASLPYSHNWYSTTVEKWFVFFCHLFLYWLVWQTNRWKIPCVRMLGCMCTQSCPTLCNPMDCTLPGSTIHGIFQARILAWIAISFSRVSFQPRDWTLVSGISCIGRQILYHCTTKEALRKYHVYLS